jgi:hypothetical protein
MTYSESHQKFAEYLESPEALTNPQDFLGPNTETVLNFWKWMDSLNEDQWKIVTDRYSNLDVAARNAAGYAAGYAAWNAAGDAARDAAREVSRDVAGYAARNAARIATLELMGMHIILEQGKKLTFVPMFDGI